MQDSQFCLNRAQPNLDQNGCELWIKTFKCKLSTFKNLFSVFVLVVRFHWSFQTKAKMFHLRLTVFGLYCWKSQKLHFLFFIGIKEVTTGRTCLSSDTLENTGTWTAENRSFSDLVENHLEKFRISLCMLLDEQILFRIFIRLDWRTLQGSNSVLHYSSIGITEL